MFYIIAGFSTHIKKPVFEADAMDARKYIDFLQKKQNSGHLKESVCACICSELCRFYEYVCAMGYMEGNPFPSFPSIFQFPGSLSSASLPSLKDVDLLLSLCANEPMLFTSVLLALRMALPIREIVDLKKEQLCTDQNGDEIYLSAWRWKDGRKENCFLIVPSDVVPFLRETFLMTPEDYPYLLQNKAGRPYAIRSLQSALARQQADSGINICYSELRSLSMYLMLVEKIPAADIAAYAGVTDRWLTLYDHIPDDLVLDAAKYVHLRIS